jgi:flagellar motor component MotA
MTHDAFTTEYKDIVVRALALSEKARREGLLSLEEDADQEKRDSRDVFEYGLRFVIDGVDGTFIEKILSNIVRQEKDEDARILKTMQKEAVLAIYEGLNPRLLYALLNSYTNITIKEAEINGTMTD